MCEAQVYTGRSCMQNRQDRKVAVDVQKINAGFCKEMDSRNQNPGRVS